MYLCVCLSLLQLDQVCFSVDVVDVVDSHPDAAAHKHTSSINKPAHNNHVTDHIRFLTSR